MMLIKKRGFLLLLLTAFIASCSTYYQKALLFQRSLQNDDPGQALTSIENIKTLKKKRNLLLYLLEKGKLQHLNKNYAESNRLFNQADTAIEDLRINYGAKTLSYLTNPEVEPYRPEDFEKVGIHYYKALNYFALKKYDDALVEAKRINLQLRKINDRYPEGKKNRYTSDAFSLILQGLIYEATGNINDAFISYRNATELYLKNDGIYYGVNIPDQLKKDLIRTAGLIGFTDEQKRYEKLFKISAKDIPSASRELLLFWENGLGPVKNQTYYTFTLLPGKEMGIATVFNKELNLAIPLPLGHKRDKSRLSDIEMFNVAFPKYETRAPFYTQAKISIPSTEYTFEKAQDFNILARENLKDRRLRELGDAALRLAVKKTSEYALRNQNNELGAILGLINAATERADTRNWQSLPGEILYTRIPLKAGENIIKITFSNPQGHTREKEIRINGEKGLQIHSCNTLQVKIIH